MADNIARFTLRNLEKMQELIEEYDAFEMSEMQRLTKLRVVIQMASLRILRKASLGWKQIIHP